MSTPIPEYLDHILDALGAGAITDADVLAAMQTTRPTLVDAWRRYELRRGATHAAVDAYWRILAALPTDDYVAPSYDADVDRMQRGPDPLEGEE